jgi:hypothetical protein
MSIQPISLQQFANKKFQRTKNYAFASKELLAELVAKEFPKAALAMPIAFVAVGDAFSPVAVLGLNTGKNLFVSLDGRWIGRYIPAVFRGYPFSIAKTEDGRQVFCINDAPGVISDVDGEPFFEQTSEPTQAVKDIFDFLTQTASNRLVTMQIIKVIQKHQLIVPWVIKIKGADQTEHTMNGLRLWLRSGKLALYPLFFVNYCRCNICRCCQNLQKRNKRLLKQFHSSKQNRVRLICRFWLTTRPSVLKTYHK